MRLFLLIPGVFLVVVVAGQDQKTNCSIDPDLIYFEDKDLEGVIKSLYSSGDCSPVIWEEEVINVLQKHKKQILDMSIRDKTMLRYLISFVTLPEAERPPPDYFLYLGTLSESEIMNPLYFGPSTESSQKPEDDSISPIFWKFGSDRETGRSTSTNRRKRQLEGFSWLPRPSRTGVSRNQRPESFTFHDEFERPSRFVGNMPNRFFEKSSNNYPTDSKNIYKIGTALQQNHRDQFRYEEQEDFSEKPQSNQIRKNDFIRPSTQQNHETEDFWINSQRKPGNYNHRRQENESSYKRPRPQGLLADSFNRSPNRSSGNSFSPANPVRAVENGIRDEFENPFNRPRPQGRPRDSFFRPGNSFKPDDQRRPSFNVDGIFGPQRQQLEDNDIIMPDDPRLTENFDRENSVFGNNNQVTTERPLRTSTRPGPPAWATPPSLCVRNCPNTPEFNPVCGSDRVTYSNPGRLRCVQQCGKAGVALNYYGTCVTTTTDFSTSAPQTTPASLSARSTNRNI